MCAPPTVARDGVVERLWVCLLGARLTGVIVGHSILNRLARSQQSRTQLMISYDSSCSIAHGHVPEVIHPQMLTPMLEVRL